jgi:hypothetical protein
MSLTKRISDLERAASPAKTFQALWQDLINPDLYYERPPYSPDRGKCYTEAQTKELTGTVFLVIRYTKDWGKDSGQ